MTCNITGTAISPDGQVRRGATINFIRTPIDVVGQDIGFVVPDKMSVKTSSTGEVDFDILPGVYIGSLVPAGLDAGVSFGFSVPDQASADFADCLNDAYIELKPASVAQAEAARDIAIDARDDAVAAAASATSASDIAVAARDDAVAAKDTAVSAMDSALAAEVSANADALATAADRVQTGLDAASASASATQAALYDGPWLDNVSALLSDTSLTYTIGQPSTVASGDYVRTRAEGFSYQVSASSATDHHVTTAGGVKLYQVGQPHQWNIVGRPSSVTPVVSASAGVLNGTYYWTVTYVTADGETEASNGVGASPASKQVNVTIPVSTDSRVIARKLYRTVAGSAEPQQGKLVATINDNSTTVYTDNIADGSLGAPAPHIDTTGGKILNGTEVVGAIGSLATTFGSRAMPTGQGYACTAIGAYALEDNAGGYRNTAVGTDALRNNTTGHNNTGLGVHALDENTTGSDNAAFGLNALFKSQGNGNLAFGSNAAAELATGDNNVYVGYTAGQFKTGGSGNTAVGALASFAAGSGVQNTAIGSQSAQALTDGNFTSVFGWGAGRQVTTGNFNTALGYRALDSCVTGGENVALGPQAGFWETDSNHLWIDNRVRADLADAKVKSLVYGEFWINREGQKIDFNGQVNPLAGLGMPGRTVTADGDVTVDDTVMTCNKAGTLTLTLPTGKPDKVLILRNITANTVVSASANVQPIGGGANGTAILPATAGSWAFLRLTSNGVTWEIVMRG